MSNESSNRLATENRGPTTLGVIISVSVLSSLFTAARLFVRGKILRRLYLDDYLIIASMVCGWFNVGTVAVSLAHGFGLHSDRLSHNQETNVMFWAIVGFPAGVMAIGLPKLAVVALLTRVLNPSKRHKRYLWAMGLLCLLNLIICIIILFAQCQPTRLLWNTSVIGTCWSRWISINFSIYSGAFCAFVDIYLAVYPSIILAKLQMKTKKKVVLSIALGIGSIAGIVAVYKCTRLPSLGSRDFSYDTSDLVVWTIVESSTIIIAACIPTLQPLFELILDSRLFSTNYGRKKHGNHDPRPNSGIRSDNIELSGSQDAVMGISQAHDDQVWPRDTTIAGIGKHGSTQATVNLHRS